ncbi:NAD(P)-binding protein [Testicularia cyperi]|uniref:NAD(P)-binding protein n=1 Tax=Testicularia cyperi TaxID=1882483 RepID=A0A317XPE7_9BASI|nr:NAD(P)-binding protein [Testicularia cyperi]
MTTRASSNNNKLSTSVNRRTRPNFFTVDTIVNNLLRPFFHNRPLALVSTLLALYQVLDPTKLTYLRSRRDLSGREKLHELWAYFKDGLANSKFLKYYLAIMAIKTINGVGNQLLVDRQAPRKIVWREHVVVITGGGRGICGELCKQLRRKGAKVVVLDLHPKSEHGAETLYIQTDVTDIKSLIAAKEKMEKEVGLCTMLVVGAGLARHSMLLDTEEQFPYHLAKQVSEVNFHGMLATLKTFGEHMLPDGGVKDRPLKQAKNGWGGHILLLGSGSAYIELPANGAYNASKAAVLSLHSTLGTELDGYHKVNNVRNSVICPLKVESAMTNGRMIDTHDQFTTPTLTIPEVAGKIVQILQEDRSRVVYIPRAMYVLAYGKNLPPWLVRGLLKAMGAFDVFLAYAKDNRHAAENIK